MTLPDVAWPVDAGKRLRMASVVRAVATRADVDVAVLFAAADPAMRPVPPEVEPGRWTVLSPASRPRWRTAGIAVAHLVPWQVAVQPWDEVRRRLAGWSGPYDLVWFGALDHAVSLAGAVAAPRVVVDCDDVESEKLRRFLALPASATLPRRDRLQRRLELPLWERVQRRVLRGADAVLVCSDLDAERLRRVAPAGTADRVAVVPNTYPEPDRPLDRRPVGACTVVTIGDYGNDQNVDAAGFAVEQVLPALLARVPGARLRLIGRRAERVGGLRGRPGLDLVGPVDDVRAELARAHAVLVPIRYGGGTRLKILEALALGVPVVTTPLGAEGLAVVAGEHVLVADDAAGLADALALVAADSDLAQRLATAGHRLYEQLYRPAAATAAVGAVLGRVLSLSPAS